MIDELLKHDARPLVSFIVPLDDVELQTAGTELIDSLFAQQRADWELVVVVSAGAAVPGVIHEATRDSRVRVARTTGSHDLPSSMNVGIGAAHGPFLAFAGINDLVDELAVYCLATGFGKSPDIEIVFTDEAEMDAHDKIRRTIRKPDYSPERLRSQNSIGDLTFYRAALLRSIGGARSGVDGAEFYDLILRATRRARVVEHIPQVLYFRRMVDPPIDWAVSRGKLVAAARRVLADHLEATGGGTVGEEVADGIFRTHRPIKGSPLVSIVIPTRGGRAVVRGEDRCLIIDAVQSIVTSTEYPNYEIIVVIDSGAEQGVEAALHNLAGDRISFIHWTGPFSFAGKMNLGVLNARGEFVLLLNDDVEVISPEWLGAMLALAQLPGAGMVGAMLYYDDDTIQHAGHLYYGGDLPHIGHLAPRGTAGPLGGLLVEREVSGVTAACALLPREVFLRVGGFSDLLPLNFNDVDLSMKLTWLGYDIYWTPYAELYHYESGSRAPTVYEYEVNTLRRRWEPWMSAPMYWPYHPSEWGSLASAHES